MATVHHCARIHLDGGNLDFMTESVVVNHRGSALRAGSDGVQIVLTDGRVVHVHPDGVVDFCKMSDLSEEARRSLEFALDYGKPRGREPKDATAELSTREWVDASDVDLILPASAGPNGGQVHAARIAGRRSGPFRLHLFYKDEGEFPTIEDAQDFARERIKEVEASAQAKKPGKG